MNAVIKKDFDEQHYQIMEKVVMEGDLSKLSAKERLEYYKNVCESVGLNPLTRPFEYIKFQGKMVLYARREATEQLRFIHKVSIHKMEKEPIGDVYVVTAYAKSADGKEDVATGAVCTTGLKGEALSNAYMKAETKAKRRVTLSICGLGMTDTSEVDSIPHAQAVKVNMETGEIEEPELIEAKEIETPVDSLVDSLKACQHLTDLKNTFAALYRKYHDNHYILDILSNVKDERKIELEAKAKATIEQFNQEAAQVPDFT